ncbi:hypothetical protein Pfo_031078 [Paulownia fortunei]|nr:hypothetical protein Pfo_031078 [Paulownia fortunei]
MTNFVISVSSSIGRLTLVVFFLLLLPPKSKCTLSHTQHTQTLSLTHIQYNRFVRFPCYKPIVLITPKILLRVLPLLFLINEFQGFELDEAVSEILIIW